MQCKLIYQTPDTIMSSKMQIEVISYSGPLKNTTFPRLLR